MSTTNRETSASKRKKGERENENEGSNGDNVEQSKTFSVEEILGDESQSSAQEQQNVHADHKKVLPDMDDYSALLQVDYNKIDDMSLEEKGKIWRCFLSTSCYAWFSRKYRFIEGHSRESARDIYITQLGKYLNKYGFVEESLDDESRLSIQRALNTLLLDKGVAWRFIDLSFDEIDRSLRNGIRGLIKFMNFDIKLLAIPGNKIYNLECNIETMLSGCNCFSNINESNKNSIFFTIAAVITFLGSPSKANLDMNKIIKICEKLLKGESVSTSKFINLIQMPVLSQIAGIMECDSNKIPLSKGTLIADHKRTNVFGRGIQITKGWEGKLPTQINGCESKSIFYYLQKLVCQDIKNKRR